MEKASGKRGFSLGQRLALIGVLLVVLVLSPVFWHPVEQAMQSETPSPTKLAPEPVKPVAARDEKPAQKSVPVETAQVTKGPLTEQVTAVGSLRSDESVVISSEIAGRINEIHFKGGRRSRRARRSSRSTIPSIRLSCIRPRPNGCSPSKAISA